MKQYLLYLIGIFTLFVLQTSCKQNTSTNHQGKVKVEIETFEVDNGYGYNLLTDGEVRIKQPYIPAVGGKQPFVSEEEARRVGEYLIEKLKKGKRPIMTGKELQELNITFK